MVGAMAEVVRGRGAVKVKGDLGTTMWETKRRRRGRTWESATIASSEKRRRRRGRRKGDRMLVGASVTDCDRLCCVLCTSSCNCSERLIVGRQGMAATSLGCCFLNSEALVDTP